MEHFIIPIWAYGFNTDSNVVELDPPSVYAVEQTLVIDQEELVIQRAFINQLMIVDVVEAIKEVHSLQLSYFKNYSHLHRDLREILNDGMSRLYIELMEAYRVNTHKIPTDFFEKLSKIHREQYRIVYGKYFTQSSN